MNVKSCTFWLGLLLMTLVSGSARAMTGAYMTKIECSNYAPEILKNVSCYVNRTSQSTGSFSLEFSLNEDIHDVQGLYKVSVKRGSSIIEYLSIKIDICEALGGFKSNYLLKMFVTEVRRVSNLPFECPVRLNKLYYIREFTIDAKALPSYLPEMDFISDIQLNFKNKKASRVLIHGRLVRN